LAHARELVVADEPHQVTLARNAEGSHAVVRARHTMAVGHARADSAESDVLEARWQVEQRVVAFDEGAVATAAATGRALTQERQKWHSGEQAALLDEVTAIELSEVHVTLPLAGVRVRTGGASQTQRAPWVTARQTAGDVRDARASVSALESEGEGKRSVKKLQFWRSQRPCALEQVNLRDRDQPITVDHACPG
jgi:hypothetical protein